MSSCARARALERGGGAALSSVYESIFLLRQSFHPASAVQRCPKQLAHHVRQVVVWSGSADAPHSAPVAHGRLKARRPRAAMADDRGRE